MSQVHGPAHELEALRARCARLQTERDKFKEALWTLRASFSALQTHAEGLELENAELKDSLSMRGDAWKIPNIPTPTQPSPSCAPQLASIASASQGSKSMDRGHPSQGTSTSEASTSRVPDPKRPDAMKSTLDSQSRDDRLSSTPQSTAPSSPKLATPPSSQEMYALPEPSTMRGASSSAMRPSNLGDASHTLATIQFFHSLPKAPASRNRAIAPIRSPELSGSMKGSDNREDCTKKPSTRPAQLTRNSNGRFSNKSSSNAKTRPSTKKKRLETADLPATTEPASALLLHVRSAKRPIPEDNPSKVESPKRARIDEAPIHESSDSAMALPDDSTLSTTTHLPSPQLSPTLPSSTQKPSRRRTEQAASAVELLSAVRRHFDLNVADDSMRYTPLSMRPQAPIFAPREPEPVAEQSPHVEAKVPQPESAPMEVDAQPSAVVPEEPIEHQEYDEAAYRKDQEEESYPKEEEEEGAEEEELMQTKQKSVAPEDEHVAMMEFMHGDPPVVEREPTPAQELVKEAALGAPEPAAELSQEGDGEGQPGPETHVDQAPEKEQEDDGEEEVKIEPTDDAPTPIAGLNQEPAPAPESTNPVPTSNPAAEPASSSASSSSASTSKVPTPELASSFSALPFTNQRLRSSVAKGSASASPAPSKRLTRTSTELSTRTRVKTHWDPATGKRIQVGPPYGKARTAKSTSAAEAEKKKLFISIKPRGGTARN